jgi:LacI family transcriptional regulator
MPSAPKQQKRPRSGKVHIGVFTRLETHFGHEVALGAQRFARKNKRWSFCTIAHGDALTEQFVGECNIDGIIVQENSAHTVPVETLWQTRLPTVLVGTGVHPANTSPLVQPDLTAVGLMATRFFRSKGIRTLCFFHAGDTPLLHALQAALPENPSPQDSDLRLETILLPEELPPESPQANALITTLKALPPRTGLLAPSDFLAGILLSMCREARMRVPGHLAVLGIGNEAAFSASQAPGDLSSIHLRPERIGFEAAILMEGLTQALPRGTASPPVPVLVPPLRVVERASTPDTLIDDSLVREVLSYIETNATSGLEIPDIVKHFGVNRRTLERRVRKCLQSSLHHEILSRQIIRAQDMLTNSSMTISAVASASGFAEPRLLNLAFKRQLGMTPSSFRGNSEKSRLESKT